MSDEKERLEAGGWPDDEVRRLLSLAQAGDEIARGTLVEANLRLVRSIVARFASANHDLEDLFQVGCIGLLKAIDRFDLSYDVRFSTYAVPLILGEIRRYLRDDGPMRVSRSLKQLAQQARKSREALAGTLGREPTIAELADALGESKEEVVAALDGAKPLSSIYQTVHEGDGEPIYLLDQLAAEGPREGLWLDRVLLKEGLARLQPRERLILLLRYFKDRTQAEVAEVIGISQVQVSRLERRALETIRSFYEA